MASCGDTSVYPGKIQRPAGASVYMQRALSTRLASASIGYLSADMLHIINNFWPPELACGFATPHESDSQADQLQTIGKRVVNSLVHSSIL